MDSEDASAICRTCLSQTVPLVSIFQVFNGSTTLCKMLHECTSLLIIKDDYLPKNICTSCAEQLHGAYSFRKLCELSDSTLRTSGLHQQEQEVPRLPSSNQENKDKDLESPDALGLPELSNLDEEIDQEGLENYNIDNYLNQIADTSEPFKVNKGIRCQECDKAFMSLASYWKHVSNVHESIKCEHCHKGFRTQDLLTGHKCTKRTKNKFFPISKALKKRDPTTTCDICNKKFRFHSNLERHRRIHTGEKPYLCNVCGIGFGQLSYLKLHSFTHTGEKPYRCKFCSKTFAAPGTLSTHVRTHTGARPHVCRICGKDFPQSGYLTTHIRTHTGEKPLECQVCHMRFSQSGRLGVHMRIHSGEKPFSCKVCGRGFAVSGTLKKHMRTHTGERPYVCSVCGLAFGQRGTLTTHMKIHNKST